MGSEMALRELDGYDMSSAGAYGDNDPTRLAEDDILRRLNDAAPKRHQVEQIQRFAGLAIGLSSVFAENILSHPCVTLRRQCQVHCDSKWYHLTPFTLFHVIYNVHRNQSPLTTWKGIGSTFVVRGILLVSEAAVSEFTPCPREVSRHSSLKKISQHLALKGLSYMITTPFIAASLVETVQSEVVTDRVNIIETLREGFWRIYSSNGHSSLLLPVWRLWPITVTYGVSHYVVKSLVQYAVMVAMRADFHDDRANQDDRSKEPPPAVTMYERYYPELMATFAGSLIADTMLYPLETVLHRLMLQGTRTIIDNTDTGLDVMPINTRYDGFMDCLNTIAREEGITGYYKGFGALVLQYSIHLGLLKLTQFLFEQIAQHLTDRSDKRGN